MLKVLAVSVRSGDCTTLRVVHGTLAAAKRSPLQRGMRGRHLNARGPGGGVDGSDFADVSAQKEEE